MKLLYYARKIMLGLLLRCPNCEQGRMFRGLFQIEEICPHCAARFERKEGESIGGTMLNLGIAELLTIAGFVTTKLVFNPSLAFQLIFWVSFNLIFVILFYRHARAMWVSVVYLAGGVYPDHPDDSKSR